MSKDFDSNWLRSHEMKRAVKLPVAVGATDGSESDLHTDISAELKRRRLYFVHSRMDKRTTTQLGVTDYIIAMPNGKTLWLEVKKRGNKLSQSQAITRHILLASGHWHEVVYSMAEFMKLITLAETIKEEEME